MEHFCSVFNGKKIIVEVSIFSRENCVVQIIKEAGEFSAFVFERLRPTVKTAQVRRGTGEIKQSL